MFGNIIAALLLLAARPIDLSSSSKAARIDELVSRYAEDGYVNGAVLVAEHGRVIFERGVGEADMESHRPNTPRTKFGIASITKQFTAVLVLQQVKEGRIRLDGTVSDYLPWYRRDTGQRMTIEQLLHHTSGLPDFVTPEFVRSEIARRHSDVRAFAEKFCQGNLQFKPGTRWDYSNANYLLLGLILERVTGTSYADLLTRRLLQPLGMNDSGIDRNDLAQRGGALGYERHWGPTYRRGLFEDRSHIYAAGAMYSTIEDLFRWNEALSGNSLPQDIRDQIFRPGLGNWGYGWFITTIPKGEPGAGSTMAEMRGDLPGNYFSWILRYPQQDDVIIVLRNVYGPPMPPLERNIQAILFDEEPQMPRRNPQDVMWSHRWMIVLILVAGAGIWLAARRN